MKVQQLCKALLDPVVEAEPDGVAITGENLCDGAAGKDERVAAVRRADRFRRPRGADRAVLGERNERRRLDAPHWVHAPPAIGMRCMVALP